MDHKAVADEVRAAARAHMASVVAGSSEDTHEAANGLLLWVASLLDRLGDSPVPMGPLPVGLMVRKMMEGHFVLRLGGQFEVEAHTGPMPDMPDGGLPSEIREQLAESFASALLGGLLRVKDRHMNVAASRAPDETLADRRMSNSRKNGLYVVGQDDD